MKFVILFALFVIAAFATETVVEQPVAEEGALPAGPPQPQGIAQEQPVVQEELPEQVPAFQPAEEEELEEEIPQWQPHFPPANVNFGEEQAHGEDEGGVPAPLHPELVRAGQQQQHGGEESDFSSDED